MYVYAQSHCHLAVAALDLDSLGGISQSFVHHFDGSLFCRKRFFILRFLSSIRLDTDRNGHDLLLAIRSLFQLGLLALLLSLFAKLAIRTINVSHDLARFVNGSFVTELLPDTINELSSCLSRLGLLASVGLSQEATGRIQGLDGLDDFGSQRTLLGEVRWVKAAFRSKASLRRRVFPV